MAYGDLIGDISQAYMTNAERAAKNGVQSLTGGPIARASGQLPVAGGLAAGATATASTPTPPGVNPNPTHLGDYFTNPAQLARPPQPQSLESVRPVGVTPTATSPTYPTNSQAAASLADGLKQSTTVSAPGIQQPINAVTAGRNSLSLNSVPDVPVSAPASNDLQPVDSTYRLTGAGSGSNAIAARVGADGVPEFSNQPTDLASARMAATVNNPAPTPTSLADLRPGGRSADPSASFASLGSLSNLGDGIGGGLSVGAPGDSQLAYDRFQRAIDQRNSYKAQDRLDQAMGAKWQADHTNVVHDSSRPITARELKTDADYAQMKDSAARNVGLAQAYIVNQHGNQEAARQDVKAQRLEDAYQAAALPDATPEQKQRYQTLSDPTGAGALNRQLTQAKIDETKSSSDKSQAEAAKLRSEANPTGGPKLTEGQSKDFNYYERGNAANAELAKNGTALTNAATGDRSRARGLLDSAIRAIPFGIGDSPGVNALVSTERQQAEQSGREVINALLRKDSGAALTSEEIAQYGKTYLPQPGDSDEVLEQKANARTRALQAIKDGLGNVSGIAGPVNQGPAKPVQAAAQQTQAPSSPVRVNSPADLQGLPSGTLFLTPDGKTKRVP